MIQVRGILNCGDLGIHEAHLFFANQKLVSLYLPGSHEDLLDSLDPTIKGLFEAAHAASPATELIDLLALAKENE